ncbi:MAG: NADH-quinone oxidoreductase subunit C [Actinobacteria bacterium]|nr:NADH-quinone oxidoreductase subunit C [Actinomycetota bacterium]
MSDESPQGDADAAETVEEIAIADPVAAAVVEGFPGSVAVESHGQSVVYVDRGVLAEVTKRLRDAERFTQCTDVTAVDHAADVERVEIPGVVRERFEVVVNLLSHPRNARIRLICQVPEDDPTVPSVTPLFPGANFPEREAYDMFGITFDGHPDLARILMPDDWDGHPLRKDDPIARIPVTFKGDPAPR